MLRTAGCRGHSGANTRSWLKACAMPLANRSSMKTLASKCGGVRSSGWWADRADHPGTSAVVNLPATSSARYVLGVVPEAQRSARVWRTWFQIADESVAGMHEWARAIGSGPLLPLLAAIGEDDAYSFSRAQSALVDGHDRQHRPDGI